ncbi:MAG: hypothetical protein AAFQ80_22080 [Cyanobacteria bacterium J06621_8]
MNNVEMCSFAINRKDLRDIALMLAENQLFIPSFVVDKIDIYNPIAYLNEYITFGTQVILVADRNLVTRWIALIENKSQEKKLKIDHQYRLAAAIMAFAQCSNISIEPSIALYEFAMNAGNDEANKELNIFRIADNINPQSWTDLALGRSDTFIYESPQLPEMYFNQKVDFMMPLKSWRRNYVLTLKIAELELKGSTPENNILEIIKWMYEDFLFGANALMLANYYFAPGKPRKKLLKNLRSADRKKAIKGIKNATWDLTLLTEWFNRIEDCHNNGEIILLCSLDKKLREIALSRIDLSEDLDLSDIYLKQFKIFWKEDIASKISIIYEDYLKKLNHSSRKLNEYNYRTKMEKFILDGEKFILDWIK